jgi:hypothetical protein
MTNDLLVDLGEEYVMKNGLEATLTIGVYNDSTDSLSDTSDIGDITSEPSNTNYSRQTAAFTASDLSGNWGVDNDTQVSFDFNDVTPSDGTNQDVDTAFVAISFQAEDTGDSASNLHLLSNPALSQTREIGSIDSLDFAAGDLSISLD